IWNEVNAPRFLALRGELEKALAPFGRAAIDALAPARGDSALDVGCGFGATTTDLAFRVGPSGRVLGVDVCEPFLAAARAEAPAPLLLQLGPSAAILRDAGEATERLRPVIEADLRAALVPFATPRGIELPAMALVATASRDASA